MSGAQSYLRHLLDIYEVDIQPGKVFEQHPVLSRAEINGGTASLFGGGAPVLGYTRERMDMYLPKICVWEMKGPEEKDLGKHHKQVLGYWAITRTRYMVLCNFHELWIYDTDVEGGQLEPAMKLKLSDLPAHPEALLFLRGEEAYFAQRAERITQKMAGNVGALVRELLDDEANQGRERENITRFFLQCVFAMFAEDADLIPAGMFTTVLDAAYKAGRMDSVYVLFDDFSRSNANDKSNPYAPYINGALFDRDQPRLHLSREQMEQLYLAAKAFDWYDVRPEIFGSIFEQALHKSQRHEWGMHFTRETDIAKVIMPTVVEPWRQRIRAVRTPKDALRAIEQMRAYHILDPACGCGNFLYVAYREMKRLEAALRARWHEVHLAKVSRKADIPPSPPGAYFGLSQMHGIEIDGFAAQLARVVLWIGEYLAAREHGLIDETLPLKNLDEVIQCADALDAPWPRPDGELAIIGNPPYLGVRKMRAELGDEYVEKLFAAFPDNHAADYVTYWFPPALRTLRPGERAGYVTTNSIAQNESREASIDKILAAGGTITDAWKSYPWPGDAAVHVSIVNWIMARDEGIKRLDDREVGVITPRLTNATDVTGAKTIPANKGMSFMGVTPGNAGFILDEEQRAAIVAEDPTSATVIKPYLIGRDINREIDQRPTRWIVDLDSFGQEEAQQYLGAYRHVQREVYHIRKTNRRDAYARLWWRFVEPRPGMRAAFAGNQRCLAVSLVSPHMAFAWMNTAIVPGNTVIVATLPSDYAFGLLQSLIHQTWVLQHGSTLKSDQRYTPTTVFETFPFPLLPNGGYDPRVVPDTPEAAAVSAAAEALYTRRAALCRERQLGLTKLYNLMKAGDLPELQTLHDTLNDAVTACYAWPEGTWRDDNEVLTRLLALNRQLTLTGGGLL
jgi:hypothetical protein